MASAQQLIGMIRSHAAGDDDRFLSIAEEIAGEAGRAGRSKVAADLTALVAGLRADGRGTRRGSDLTSLAAPRGELANLLRAAYSETVLSDLVLSQALGHRLGRLVREHRERDKLEEHGLAPRRKFLFSGPPGTGKTMTASAIAGELNLPLFTIMLDGVITKYMGETAAKLRLIFDAMHRTRGVYFFDEVDALATRRGNDNDIGEARRVLNSFLQFLDEDRSSSVIVAATNHQSLLDPALFRRFHATFAYEKPSSSEARRVLGNHLLQFDTASLDWGRLDEATRGLSHADLTAAADDAARDAVLDFDGRLETGLLLRALCDRSEQDATG
ncbi:ATP-binding protein [Methylobacterium sp. J-059]|uniref:AAA family ATPase n=1 Tax=Methylobacterium sp. J-059 TaxID=2836643 RepID=UPI001FBAA172|nr:ATP-binding protein [Methylobacterium sp. J-059]MCJ2041036.1 ATP-binding protein [Methylobacterium sp. J-059]